MQPLVVKTVQTYLDKISLKAPGTILNVEAALTKFDNFTLEKKGKTLNEFMAELKEIKDQETQFEVLFEHLQNFVNFLDKDGFVSQGARNYIYSIKGFVRYCGIKIHKEDLKDNITYRRIEKQDREPITREQLKQIVMEADPRRKAFYLSNSSSGMRPQESLQLRKRDFDLSLERIRIRIPAKYTKTKKSRDTYISKEAAEYVKPILSSIGPDGLVFGTSENPKRAILTEEQYFNAIRKKLHLTDKYDSGVHKITLGGSLRSWFITKANRIDYGFGHALAGHEQYMKNYDRLSLAEKFQLYIRAEPTLLVFEEEPKTNQELAQKVKELEEKLREQNEMISPEQLAEMKEVMAKHKHDIQEWYNQSQSYMEFIESKYPYSNLIQSKNPYPLADEPEKPKKSRSRTK
jgi:integrase